MKKVLIALAAVVALVIIVLLAAPFFIPAETYKTQIAQAAYDATGRELNIKGDMRLSLFPRIELEAADVSFANAPGAAEPDMARLQKLQVQLQIWPLLSGQVRVDSFILVQPVIHLEVDKAGQPNWVFAKAGMPAAGGGATSTPAPSASDSGGIPEISLGDVRLVDGLVTYIDARSGQRVELSAINMAVSLPNMDSPVATDGSLVWNGRKLTLKAKSEALRGLMAGITTPVSIGLESDVVNLSYEGTVTKAEPAKVDGTVDLDIPSLRELAAWTGNPLTAGGKGLGPLKIKGKVAASPGKAAFTEAQIALDDIKAEGDLTADVTSGKPYVKGRLDVDRLDLNTYMPPPAEDSAGTSSASSGGGQPAKPADWSDEPIDLGGLKLVNADFALSVNEIVAQKVKIGRSVLVAALKDGLLDLNLNELNLYDGTGTGKVTVDARGKIPSVAETFALDGIEAQPLLTDAAGFDRLEGAGAMNLSVTTKGNTQREMVQNLNGNGAFKFLDGAVRGLNLAAMLRNVGSAFTDKSARETQKTDFAELSGTFKIDKGIVRNDDMLLRNPLLRVTGAGTADAPKRTVNYRIEPKAVASLEGQGAAGDAKGVAVPVIVEGPWDNVTYRPDLTAMITDIAKDPTKALEGAKDTLKQLQGGAGGLLGGTATPPADGGESTGGAVPDPGTVLKKLLGN
ncbi:MAG TPA: AsmA family protein [Kiloniellales bacterium]|jgi:AsmA protein